MTAPCPCGSALPLPECCLRYIDGPAAAPTAEALMRSRYTAYALGRVPYLLATSHPELRPAPDAAGIAKWCQQTLFLQLLVAETKAGGPEDEEGTVRFIAWYKENGRLGGMHERSAFARVDGRWAYRSGQHQSLKLPGANDPCPCLSGKKFKKCCG